LRGSSDHQTFQGGPEKKTKRPKGVQSLVGGRQGGEADDGRGPSLGKKGEGPESSYRGNAEHRVVQIRATKWGLGTAAQKFPGGLNCEWDQKEQGEGRLRATQEVAREKREKPEGQTTLLRSESSENEIKGSKNRSVSWGGGEDSGREEKVEEGRRRVRKDLEKTAFDCYPPCRLHGEPGFDAEGKTTITFKI